MRKEQSGHDVVSDAGLAGDSSTSHAAYLTLINNARKIVAVAMAVCGVGLVVCVNRDDYLRLTLRRESGIWAWGSWVFGIGVMVCMTAGLLLIVEYLARPVARRRLSVRSLFIRSLFIVIGICTVCFSMALAFGPGQAIGSTIGIFLLIAVVRNHGLARGTLAVFAAIVLGLTLLTTQSSYQYARWHADEIVAAGFDLMDKCPKTQYYTYNPNPESDPSGILAIFGEEIDAGDPRIPVVLRKLGARRIWVDEERVAVFIGSTKFDFYTFPRPEIEFQIFRHPHPSATVAPVWGFAGKGATKITDRLWTNDY